MGWGSTDATKKSSVSWACGDRRTGKEGGQTQEGEAAKSNQNEEDEQQVTRLDEEKRNLVNIRKWMNDEKKSLKKMMNAENEKNLHTEILKVLNEQLKTVEHKIRELQHSSKNPYHALSKHLLRAREMPQNDFWQDQSRPSMLVAAGAQTEHHIEDVRPNTSSFDQSREHHTFPGAENTNTLSGIPFETVLRTLQGRLRDKPFEGL